MLMLFKEFKMRVQTKRTERTVIAGYIITVIAILYFMIEIVIR